MYKTLHKKQGSVTVQLRFARSSVTFCAKRDINQRNGACACVLGVDIGAYDTCGHLCKYCYANADVNLVKENRKKHNPKSPFLIGESMSGDVIHEAEQKNWIDRQLRFDFF